jgi:hypothetical protein
VFYDYFSQAAGSVAGFPTEGDAVLQTGDEPNIFIFVLGHKFSAFNVRKMHRTFTNFKTLTGSTG